MKPLTAVALYRPGLLFEKTIHSLRESDLMESILVVSEKERVPFTGCDLLLGPESWSHETVRLVLDRVRTTHLLFFPAYEPVAIDRTGLERMLAMGDRTGAGLVYSDFYDRGGTQTNVHPLNDYQTGSARDDFDFGPVILFSVSAVRNTLRKHGIMSGLKFGALYDLLF